MYQAASSYIYYYLLIPQVSNRADAVRAMHATREPATGRYHQRWVLC
jgi:2-keto-3-deoxy-L-rhamnonate aldolase RhmA